MSQSKHNQSPNGTSKLALPDPEVVAVTRFRQEKDSWLKEGCWSSACGYLS